MVVDRRQIHSDRRTSSRVAAIFAVKSEVVAPAARGARAELGQAEDISAGGMTLRRPKDVALAPETPVRLAFELPGTGEEITVGGVVVRDGRIGRWRRLGVRFVDLSDEHARLIESHCDAGVVSLRG